MGGCVCKYRYLVRWLNAMPHSKRMRGREGKKSNAAADDDGVDDEMVRSQFCERAIECISHFFAVICEIMIAFPITFVTVAKLNVCTVTC